MHDLRRMSLEEVTRHAVEKMISLGFSQAEILEAVQRQVEQKDSMDKPDILETDLNE